MNATSSTSSFSEQVEEERRNQIEHWGDDHPNRYTLIEWADLIGQNWARLSVYSEEATRTGYTDKVRLTLVALAATSMAMHEAIERAERRGQ